MGAERTGRAWAATCPVGRGRVPGQGARRPSLPGTGTGQYGSCTQAQASQQALDLAVALGDSALQRLASHTLGQACYAIGDFSRAAELWWRNVEVAERESGTPGQAVRIWSQAWLARTLSALGAFAEGQRHGEEALRLAT